MRGDRDRDRGGGAAVTTEQSMALKAVVEAVTILRAADHYAVAAALEEAVIALADECDQQRTRADSLQQELWEERDLRERNLQDAEIRAEFENEARKARGIEAEETAP